MLTAKIRSSLDIADFGLIPVVLSACRQSLMPGQNTCMLLRRNGRNEPFFQLFTLPVGMETLSCRIFGDWTEPFES